jgi:plastocyanin
MKTSLFTVLLVISALAFGKEHTIVIEGMKFVPEELNVKVGDTILWVNKDFFPHTATAFNKAFNSKSIPANKSWKYVPEKSGKFPYRCLFHKPMTGVLTVN